MALLNTLDPEDVSRRLERWLATKVPGGEATISDLQVPQASGLSMNTVLFKAQWGRGAERLGVDLVARVEPTGPSLFERPDLGREFKVLRALGDHSDVRVPPVRWFEPDESVLGARFLVMDREFGLVPADDPPYSVDGWVVGLDPNRRSRLCDGTLGMMAKVHAVDWAALDLDFLCVPELEPGVGQQMAEVERFYASVHGGERSPTIDAAFDILGQQLPSSEELVLNWGDARIGNVIFDPDTIEVQALLDWEIAAIASPEMDLGWFLFSTRFFTEGIGVEPLPGLQTREELIARYESLTGRTVRHMSFYEALAALRTSIIVMRIGRLLIAAGALPVDSPMPLSNPASQLLAKLLELPEPAGEAVNFIGNR
jgi:aminoglycoside phosphotransferase (APT) family kinase protein